MLNPVKLLKYLYYRCLFKYLDNKYKKDGFLISSEMNIYEEARIFYPYYEQYATSSKKKAGDEI